VRGNRAGGTASHTRAARHATSAASASEQHRSTVYTKLRNAILAGTLKPMERITENQVAARFGLSRTPVREAFRRLEGEGLILVVPQRGSFVSQPSVEDILEIYQMRAPLEGMAARIAADSITDEQLRHLEDLLSAEAERRGRPSAERSLRLNREFHAIIFACTRNKRMAALLMDMQDQVHRVRVLWPSTLARLGETWKEHEQILAALKQRDGEAAERLMRGHLECARASTLNGILPSEAGVAMTGSASSMTAWRLAR
jgi:DNA-binding GntR family transcriptional regulator